jgi:hypothetical protein
MKVILTQDIDKLGNAGGSIYTTTKIHRVTVQDVDVLVGFSGAGDRCGSFLHWIKEGRDPAKYPPNPTDDNCFMLVIEQDGRILRYEDTPWPQIIQSKFYAIGSGSDCCRTAMHLGKTAAEAVEIASLFDIGCGNGVDVLTFDCVGK